MNDFFPLLLPFLLFFFVCIFETQFGGFNIGMTLAAPVLGWLSDRFNPCDISSPVLNIFIRVRTCCATSTHAQDLMTLFCVGLTVCPSNCCVPSACAFHSKQVLCMCTFLSGMGNLVYLFGHSDQRIYLLFIGRMLSGVGTHWPIRFARL
jgi:MFS family permease